MDYTGRENSYFFKAASRYQTYDHFLVVILDESSAVYHTAEDNAVELISSAYGRNFGCIRVWRP